MADSFSKQEGVGEIKGILKGSQKSSQRKPSFQGKTSFFEPVKLENQGSQKVTNNLAPPGSLKAAFNPDMKNKTAATTF